MLQIVIFLDYVKWDHVKHSFCSPDLPREVAMIRNPKYKENKEEKYEKARKFDGLHLLFS